MIGMSVDIANLPERQKWLDILQSNFSFLIHEKKFFYVIWLLNNQSIGHSIVNKIVTSEEAYRHLHLWQKSVRKKGLGIEFLTLTIPIFFETFSLKRLYCEPLAANVAPNKTLDKLGFDFVKSYETLLAGSTLFKLLTGGVCQKRNTSLYIPPDSSSRAMRMFTPKHSLDHYP
jgi:RimJ/RimL family protein N-acetyltransferase